MKVLLDTNILIHREAATVARQDIGLLFNWLDRLGYEKNIHPASVEEVNEHQDPKVRSSFTAKLGSYHLIQAPGALAPKLQELSEASDKTINDRRDTAILNELVVEHVDILITEDRGMISKAEKLGLSAKVFKIDEFMEKATVENPGLIEYHRVLGVQKTLFGHVALDGPIL